MTATSQPHAFVIFGATGDLTKRKLLSAFWGLYKRNLVPDGSFILGVARKQMTDDEFTQMAQEALHETGLSDPAVKLRLHYQALDEVDFSPLVKRLAELEKTYRSGGNRVFYLALPADKFGGTIVGLGEAGLAKSQGWTRLVIEKPFGTNMQTAKELKSTIERYFSEEQVYLIDHYLGKETVQNIMMFRFSNLIFESLWSRDRIDYVQITVAEELGLEGRAGYYEHSGALRDMIQNHISQVLAVVAMEVPSAYGAAALRSEKTKLLRAVVPPSPEDAVFGQYTAGTFRDQDVVGYKQEPGVKADSRTETFAALRLEIDNWRWQGVPFYIRTGKRLPRKTSQVAVVFRSVPTSLFKSLGMPTLPTNILRITLQPDEGFSLHFNVKRPGQTPEVRSMPLSFRYRETFGPLTDAYETLLYDAICGDQSLFVHTDAVEAAWRLYDPLLTGNVAVHSYPAGTWGPKQADKLLRDPRHRWLNS
jgi:glucose-6-phosphate 1-dehydrogenase